MIARKVLSFKNKEVIGVKQKNHLKQNKNKKRENKKIDAQN